MKEDLTILSALAVTGYGVFIMFGLAPALITCGGYVLLVSLIGALKQ